MSDSLKTIDEVLKYIKREESNRRQDIAGGIIPVSIDGIYKQAKAHLEKLMARERLDELKDTSDKLKRLFYSTDGSFTDMQNLSKYIEDRFAQLEQLIAAGENEG